MRYTSQLAEFWVMMIVMECIESFDRNGSIITVIRMTKNGFMDGRNIVSFSCYPFQSVINSIHLCLHVNQ